MIYKHRRHRGGPGSDRPDWPSAFFCSAANVYGSASPGLQRKGLVYFCTSQRSGYWFLKNYKTGSTVGQWWAGLSFNQRVGSSIPALVDVSLRKTLNPELLYRQCLTASVRLSVVFSSAMRKKTHQHEHWNIFLFWDLGGDQADAGGNLLKCDRIRALCVAALIRPAGVNRGTRVIRRM